jgi:hypothetical protein
MSTSAVRCRRAHCGEYCEAVTDGLGYVVFVCPACALNKVRRCRDCSALLQSRHWMRCVRCSRARRRALGRERDRARYPLRRQAVLADHKRRTAIPAIREHRRRYMAAYRAKNARDVFDRAYQRAYMAQRRSDPVYRDKQNARKRELRAERRHTHTELAA